MTLQARWYVGVATALLAAATIMRVGPPSATAQTAYGGRPEPTRVAPAPRKARPRAKNTTAKPVAAPNPALLFPPREQFSAADEAIAAIPNMPDARFWADSATDFTKALPAQPGPWLILSSGGSDGAFGAGLLNGLSASGKRPDYSVVTGVSTGALMAPFIFAGPHYDDALHNAFTTVTAADIFEVRLTGESLLDTWPLKDTIAKQITPALLGDIAAQHNRGRRLFVVTTDLDAERSVVWNMGAIAAHGGNDALELFRSVLLASSAIPGGFPPVLIAVEANGKRFHEMHVDGGVGGQFFVAPAALMASTSDYRVPATQLYFVVNTGLQPEFEIVDRSLGGILTEAVSTAVKVDTRLMIDRSYIVAKRSNVGFNVATIPQSFSAPSRGAFDPDYMSALFQAGYQLGQSATPFSTEPPPYPGPPAIDSSEDGTTPATK